MDISNLGLGRLPSKDERDHNYLISALQAVLQPTRTSRNWYANGWWGFQGNTSKCVGYSWAHWVEDGPVTQKGAAPIVPPDDIYSGAQLIDEWPGEDYDGTSVRAGAKYLQDRGVIKEYRWAFDEPTLQYAILTVGPAVIGSQWYEDMFTPDSKYIIKPTGAVVGGHAYLIDGFSSKTGLYRIKNSWSREWGKKGFAYIHKEDMAKLISEDGEVCLALENKIIL